MRTNVRLITGMILLIGSIGFPLLPANAQTIQWWYQLAAPSFGSAATGDIDGDGQLEIVFGTYFNDEHIYALNAEDGTLSWWYDTGGCNDASPVIADVDMDGELEVIVPASSPCMVYCFNGTGDIEWSVSTGSPNCIDSPPAVADLDNDGKPEIVLGTFYGHVFCYNGEDGTLCWQANLGTNSYIQSDPGILDCDGDGQLDVIVAQWAGDERIYALRGDNGTVLWYSDLPEDYMYHGASFGDIDEDGRPEIVIGSYDGDLYVLNAEDGSLLWEYTGVLYIGAPTSIADLNGDGHLEIVFTSYNSLKVISHTGTILWTASTGGSIFRGCAIADVDGDTRLDVVFGSDDGILRALRGSNGNIIWTYNLEAHYGRTFNMDHAPLIADFNGDDSLDVFIIGGYGTSSQPTNNHGRAYVLTAGAGDGLGWTMFRHDPVHSGYFRGITSPVSISLTPENPPIIIPASGGSFDFTVALQNSSFFTQFFGAWVMVQLPNNSWYGPVLGPLNLSLPESATLSRLRTQSVPSAAPAGTFTYEARIGFFPSDVWDSDSFTFTKQGAESDGFGIESWANAGESLEILNTKETESDSPALPGEFEFSAFPNPFNATTQLTYHLPVNDLVKIEVLDVFGRTVATLVNSPVETGWHTVLFNASNLASGIYFCCWQGTDFRHVLKIVLLK